MKIRIVRTCAAKGQHCEVGTVVDFDERTCYELISLRKAVAVDEIETRDPVSLTTSRDPSIAVGDAADRVFKKRK